MTLISVLASLVNLDLVTSIASMSRVLLDRELSLSGVSDILGVVCWALETVIGLKKSSTVLVAESLLNGLEDLSLSSGGSV